jgi:hypothetical protein
MLSPGQFISSVTAWHKTGWGFLARPSFVHICVCVFSILVYFTSYLENVVIIEGNGKPTEAVFGQTKASER